MNVKLTTVSLYYLIPTRILEIKKHFPTNQTDRKKPL